MLGVKYKVPPVLIVIVVCVFSRTFSQETVTESPITTGTPSSGKVAEGSKELEISSTTDLPITTTTILPEEVCENHNSSCEVCVEAKANCYYCHSSKKCIYYPYNFPPKKVDCDDLSNVSWSTCLLNVKVIIITVCSVVGALILALIICCCCCCRKHSRNKWARQLEKWEKERKEMKQKHEERRQERQLRTDEIRKKYGLFKEDNPYSRFDG